MASHGLKTECMAPQSSESKTLSLIVLNLTTQAAQVISKSYQSTHKNCESSTVFKYTVLCWESYFNLSQWRAIMMVTTMSWSSSHLQILAALHRKGKPLPAAARHPPAAAGDGGVGGWPPSQKVGWDKTWNGIFFLGSSFPKKLRALKIWKACLRS